MTDWHESRTNTYEYYLVDPNTWTNIRKLKYVTAGSISHDSGSETLNSASITVNEEDLGECYIRVYLITIQNNKKERYPLGTFLAQTSSVKFDGKVSQPSLTAYSPLLELKDVAPPLGYSCRKKEKVLEKVHSFCEQYCRAPVIQSSSSKDILEVDFVANTSDTWLSYSIDLLSSVKYHMELDEMGKIMFAPDQEIESMQPVFTYSDDNSSILYPEITKSIDIFGVPNTLEVIYSENNLYLTSTAVNNDENSIVSVQNRGRVVFERVENPGFVGIPTQQNLDEYAEKLLKEKSKIECQITYQHGYNGVRINDCVRLNYKKAGLMDIKAKVVKQKINCDTECKVDETVVFKKKLWG